ncbi:MAG: hypothetical protein JW739_06240 [Opitutales bacterium]|nr:hypothetical protein [Opitutales bacterium]
MKRMLFIFIVFIVIHKIAVCDDSLSMDISQSCYYDYVNDQIVMNVYPYLSNCGESEIRVARQPKGESRGQYPHGINYSYGFWVHKYNGSILVESESDFSIVNLKPGDVTELPSYEILINDEDDLPPHRNIIVDYFVSPEFGNELNVWSGDLQIIVPIKIPDLFYNELNNK